MKNGGKPPCAQEHGVIRHLHMLGCLFPYQGLLGVVFISAILGGGMTDLFLGGSIYKVCLPWKTIVSEEQSQKIGFIYPRGEPSRKGVMGLGNME